MFKRLIAALVLALGLAAGALAAPDRDSAVPRYAHIVVIVEENKNYDQILDPATAPNIAGLAARYGDASRFYGEVHPSEANYVALLGGDTFGIHDDDGYYCHAGLTDPACAGAAGPGYVDHTVRAPSLGDQLAAAGLTWKGYYENLPAPGSLAVIASDPAFDAGTRKTALYAAKHSGFMNFYAVQHDPRRAERIVGFGQLDADLAADRLPSFALIVPNQCNEMHGLSGPNIPPDCSGHNPAALIARGDKAAGDLVARLQATTGVALAREHGDRDHLRRRRRQDAGRLLRGDAGRGLELRRRPHPDHRHHQPRPARLEGCDPLQPLLAAADHRGRVRHPRAPGLRRSERQGRGGDGAAVRRAGPAGGALGLDRLDLRHGLRQPAADADRLQAAGKAGGVVGLEIDARRPSPRPPPA